MHTMEDQTREVQGTKIWGDARRLKGVSEAKSAWGSMSADGNHDRRAMECYRKYKNFI